MEAALKTGNKIALATAPVSDTTAPDAPKKRGRKPGQATAPIERLDHTRPIFILLDQTKTRQIMKAFKTSEECDAEAARITLATGRYVARFGPQYAVSGPSGKVADIPLTFGNV